MAAGGDPDLTGRLRLDLSGLVAGLARAQGLLRAGLRRLTRDADGEMRRIPDSARRASNGVLAAFAALQQAGPLVAGLAASIGGLMAAFASAGAAAGAFGLAVKPQVQALTENAEAADKLADAQETAARKAALAKELEAKGSSLAEKAENAATAAKLAALDAQKAYDRQTAGLPKATADSALALAKLKNTYKEWSDGLAGDTMPVFTRGLNLLRSMLPALTPLVQAAAKGFGDFIDRMQAGVDSGGFAAFIQRLATSAQTTLPNFLTAIRNIGKGLSGLLAAFLPASGQMSSGIVDLTAKFAAWGQSLQGSEGFARFMELARQGGDTLKNLGLAVLNLMVALGPLVGTTATLINLFAQIIAGTPTPVLAALAGIITTAAIATKLYATYQTIASAATRIWAIAQLALNAAFWANPMTWVVAGIVALVAIIVLIATKTNWFQKAWSVAWSAIKSAASGAMSGIKSALNWLGSLPGKFESWFGSAKDTAVRHLSSLVSWASGLPGRLASALSSLAGKLGTSANNAGRAFVSAIKTKGGEAVNWLKGLPGKASSAVGNLDGKLASAGRQLIQGFINGITSMFGKVKSKLSGLTSMLPDWKGPAKKDARILTPAGRLLIQGFIKGIDESTAQLRARLRQITAALPNNVRSGYGRSLARATAQLQFQVSRRDLVIKQLAAAEKKLSDLKKTRDKAASDIAGGILDNANITSGNSAVNSVNAITIGLQQAVKQTQAFSANIAALKKKGLRSDLLQDIADAGVSGGAATAQALARATPAELKRINDLQAQLAKAAGATGKTVAGALYDSGVRAAQGLVDGLKKQESAIEKQMKRIAEGMAKAIKKRLGIRSPSRVFMGIGDQTGEGLRVGMLRARNSVAAASAAMASAATGAADVAGRAIAGVPQPGVLAAAYAGTAPGAGGTTNNFYLTGGEASPDGILRALSWRGLVGGR